MEADLLSNSDDGACHSESRHTSFETSNVYSTVLTTAFDSAVMSNGLIHGTNEMYPGPGHVKCFAIVASTSFSVEVIYIRSHLPNRMQRWCVGDTN